MPLPPRRPAFVKPVKALTSWSFSRYKDYDKCPLYAKLKHIDKMKEPESEPMKRGAAIAKMSEDYLSGTLRSVPKELSTFKDEYVWLRKQKTLFFEQQWGFDKNWNVVPWNDWNNCWLRVKIDIGWQEDNLVHIRDGKTGQMRERQVEDYMLQLELYAVSSMAYFPQAEGATTQLWFTDQGVVVPEPEALVYKRKDTAKLKKTWENRTKKMLSDTAFKPKPSNACSWCAFAKSKGGPCPY